MADVELAYPAQASGNMRCRFLSMFACSIGGAFATQGNAASWAIEALIGDAYNFDSSTRIEHEALGRQDIEGEYQTRGLEGPLQYAWRIARWQDNRAWELQLLHHKIYLQDPQAPVEALSVSHGFNIITINRTIQSGRWRARVGVGPVVTHAEARISNSVYDGPYEIAGAAVLVGAGSEWHITERLYVIAEASVTYGRIHASPEGTPSLRVDIRNPAMHAQLGFGYRF